MSKTVTLNIRITEEVKSMIVELSDRSGKDEFQQWRNKNYFPYRTTRNKKSQSDIVEQAIIELYSKTMTEGNEKL